MGLGKFMNIKKILFVIFVATFCQGIGSVYAGTNGDAARADEARNKKLREAESALSLAKKAEATCVPKTSGECQRLLGAVTVADINLTDIKNSNAEEAGQSKIKAADAADTKVATAALCDAEKETKKTAAKTLVSAGQNDGLDGDMGTTVMQRCVKVSSNAMRYLYGKKKKEIDWDIIIDATDECVNASPACVDPKAPEAKSKLEACAQVKKFAARCDAAAYIISTYDRDWENSEHVVTKDVKGGNPVITCKGKGIATLDYEGCVKFVQNGDIIDAGMTAVHTGQELMYKDKTMTAQAEASQSGDSATGALQALKTGVKGQEDIMNQRAVLDTGKFGLLATYYADIPTDDDLKQKCANYHAPAAKYFNGIEGTCLSVVSQQHTFAFLENQQAKEKMKAKLVKAGIDVGSDIMMASLLAKRAGDLDNAIAKVDAFVPIDPLAPPPTTDLQTTFCQQNPGDPKCLTGGLDRTFDAMGDNIITFGETGKGATFGNPNAGLNNSTGTSNAINPTARTSVASVGSAITDAQQKGGLATTVAAATVGKGTDPGGGGGGGGGGNSGGGGGGGGAPPGQAGAGVSSAIAGRAPSYGGGTGTLSMMGGYGINKSKSGAKEDGNPFGKLFNKDAKNGVVDYGRTPASQKVGNKGDNLFEMISKRYVNVNNDKRLIEYELAK